MSRKIKKGKYRDLKCKTVDAEPVSGYFFNEYIF